MVTAAATKADDKAGIATCHDFAARESEPGIQALRRDRDPDAFGFRY